MLEAAKIVDLVKSTPCLSYGFRASITGLRCLHTLLAKHRGRNLNLTINEEFYRIATALFRALYLYYEDVSIGQ